MFTVEIVTVQVEVPRKRNPSEVFRTLLFLPVARSVERLTTAWTVRDRIPGGASFSGPVQTNPGAHPASCTMGTGFPGGRGGRGLGLNPPPQLVPRS